VLALLLSSCNEHKEANESKSQQNVIVDTTKVKATKNKEMILLDTSIENKNRRYKVCFDTINDFVYYYVLSGDKVLSVDTSKQIYASCDRYYYKESEIVHIGIGEKANKNDLKKSYFYLDGYIYTIFPINGCRLALNIRNVNKDKISFSDELTFSKYIKLDTLKKIIYYEYSEYCAD
jgi:hypothetical protein